jgi:hypothetical protein
LGDDTSSSVGGASAGGSVQVISGTPVPASEIEVGVGVASDVIADFGDDDERGISCRLFRTLLGPTCHSLNVLCTHNLKRLHGKH